MKPLQKPKKIQSRISIKIRFS